MTHIFDEKTTVINTSDDPVIVDAELMQTMDQVSVGLLEQILTTLKKIEYHLMLASDAYLEDQDV